MMRVGWRLMSLGAAAWLVAASVEGTPLYRVTLDTTPMIGSADVFELAFQMTDGDGTAANTTVELGDFQFGGGTATGAASISPPGSGSGSVAIGFTLTDASFFNELIQAFVPGSALSFLVGFTSSSPSPPGALVPDSFAMAILVNGLPIETGHPAAILLGVDFDGTPVLEAYGAAPGAFYPLAAPRVEEAAGAVPEPATLTLVGLGILALGRARRRLPRRV